MHFEDGAGDRARDAAAPGAGSSRPGEGSRSIPDWLFEFKYDGFRGLCYLEQGRCRLISRNGNVLSRFDALADQAGRLLDVDEAVIDGEVIATDQTGRPSVLRAAPRAKERLLRGLRHPLG